MLFHAEGLNHYVVTVRSTLALLLQSTEHFSALSRETYLPQFEKLQEHFVDIKQHLISEESFLKKIVSVARSYEDGKLRALLTMEGDLLIFTVKAEEVLPRIIEQLRRYPTECATLRDDLQRLYSILKGIRDMSTAGAKEVEENILHIDEKVKMLQMDKANLNDFQRNVLSWLTQSV